MKSVIQNHNANLLSNTPPLLLHAQAVAVKNQNVCYIINAYPKFLSAAVSQTPSQINIQYYGTCEKTCERTVQQSYCILHLGIKANRKIWNFLSKFGN